MAAGLCVFCNEGLNAVGKLPVHFRAAGLQHDFRICDTELSWKMRLSLRWVSPSHEGSKNKLNSCVAYKSVNIYRIYFVKLSNCLLLYFSVSTS